MRIKRAPVVVGVLAGLTSGIAIGVLGALQGGPRAPATFEIRTVEMSASPEPSAAPSASPVQPPAQVSGIIQSRVPPSRWESPEAGRAGVVGERFIIVTPSGHPTAMPTK